MRGTEGSVYSALAIMFNGALQLLWGFVQVFLMFNAIAIPFVFTTGQSEAAKVAICFMGSIGHLALAIAFMSGNAWLRLLDLKISELERLDSEEVGSSESASRVRVFTDVEFQQVRETRILPVKLLWPSCCFFAVLWLVMSVYHVYLLFKGGAP